MQSETTVSPPVGLHAVAAATAAVPRTHSPWRTRALGLFGGGAACFGGAVALASAQVAPWMTSAGFGLAAVLFGLAVISGVWFLVGLRSQRPIPRGWAALVLLGPTLLGTLMMLLGAVLALMASANFARGRQIRRLGRVLLPPVHTGDEAWAAAGFEVDVPSELRPLLAAQWRENGRTEHASVAAFAQVTLRLMALGAPPELLIASQQDSLDEVRHAELCFALARGLDGQHQSPGPFPAARGALRLAPLRTLALVQLAVESLVDGAFHEGLSARLLAQLAKRCEEPRTRALLKEIAADEGKHAAHGWDVVEWCHREGGEPVDAALRGAVWKLPQRLQSGLPAGAKEGAWEPFGIHGEALEAEAVGRTRADVVRRVNALTAPSAALAKEG